MHRKPDSALRLGNYHAVDPKEDEISFNVVANQLNVLLRESLVALTRSDKRVVAVHVVAVHVVGSGEDASI